MSARPIASSMTVTLAGTQGPAGPPGTVPQGLTFETLAVVDGAQVLTLPYPVAAGWYFLCINGLRQGTSAYSVAQAVLTLPASLNVLSGDLISFEFYPILPVLPTP